MIHDVDESLRAMLRRFSVVTNDIEIAFEAPTKDWSSRRNVPTLDIYLYDIRENLDRRKTAFDEVQDENARTIKRQPPPRWFNLSYLVTAWTQRTEDEHRLLSSVLALFIQTSMIPRELLVGGLRDTAPNTYINIARPPTQDRAISDIWSALGGELKPSLDLVLTVPFQPSHAFHMGPPVIEAPSVRMAGSDGEFEIPPGRRTRKAVRDLLDDAGDLTRKPGTRRGQFAPVGADSLDREDDSAEARARRALLKASESEGEGDEADTGDADAATGTREELIAGTPKLPGRRYGFSVIEPRHHKK